MSAYPLSFDPALVGAILGLDSDICPLEAYSRVLAHEEDREAPESTLWLGALEAAAEAHWHASNDGTCVPVVVPPGREGDWAASVPLKHQLHAQLVMADLGVGEVWVLAVRVDAVPRSYRVLFDPEMSSSVVGAVERFYAEHVTPRIPPPGDSTASAVRAIESLFPKESGRTVTLPVEAVVYSQRIAEVDEARATLEREKKRLTDWLKSQIGDAERGIMPDLSAAWQYRYEKRGESESRILRKVALK